MLNTTINQSHQNEERQPRKRVKQVFSTNEIPHLWAHKTQDSARNPGRNLYFDGDTIYSYGGHFPIARHISNKRGNRAILFTTRTYSVTTSGHVSAVRSSIPSGVQVFHVYNPALSPSESLACYVSGVSALAASANGRKMETTRNEDVQAASQLIAECKQFCKFFGLKLPKFAKLPKIDAEKLARQSQAIRDRQTAKDAKRRAEWEAATAARKAEEDRWNASGICQHTPKHDAHNYGAIAQCELMREEEEWTAKSADIIEAWKNGDTTASLRNPWDLPVMLRIRNFGADEDVQHAVAEVETSRGARVPVSHAIRGLRFVRAVVQRGEAFETNGKTFHLGHYKIDRIDVDGALTAGCHVISYAEIERIAPELERIAAASEVQS
jgi:hypothetical protein